MKIETKKRENMKKEKRSKDTLKDTYHEIKIGLKVAPTIGYQSYREKLTLKGTGTQDFDLAKSGIIGKILMSRAHRRPLKIFKCFFIFLIIILKS